jgi:hypothetical protein
MCGSASTAQNNISAEQQQQYTQLMSEYSQVYGEDQGILTNLTQNLTPIINAGPSQAGYSNNELSSLNSTATEGTAQGFSQAQQALQENEAASGGSSYIPSGGTAQLAGELDATGANSLATQKSAILSGDYAQGNQDYENAVSAEEGVAGMLNPTAYAGATTNSGSAAASEANTITQQNNSIWSTVLGGIAGIGGQAAGSLAGAAGKSWFS